MVGKGSKNKQPGIDNRYGRVLIFIGNELPCEESQKLYEANASDD